MNLISALSETNQLDCSGCWLWGNIERCLGGQLIWGSPMRQPSSIRNQMLESLCAKVAMPAKK